MSYSWLQLRCFSSFNIKNYVCLNFLLVTYYHIKEIYYIPSFPLEKLWFCHSYSDLQPTNKIFCIRWKREVFSRLNKINSSYVVSFGPYSDSLQCLKYAFCRLFVEIEIQTGVFFKHYFFMLLTCEGGELSWKMF